MSEVNSGKAVESLKGVTSIDDLARQVEDLRKKVENIKPGTDDRVSIIAFSGDLDKILAAFIIATGAVAKSSLPSLCTASLFRRGLPQVAINRWLLRTCAPAVRRVSRGVNLVQYR